MNPTAYLLCLLRDGIPRAVGIYSDDNPTTIGFGCWVCLAQITEHDFESARHEMLRYCASEGFEPYYGAALARAVRKLADQGGGSIVVSIEDLVAGAPKDRAALVRALMQHADCQPEIVVQADRLLTSSPHAEKLESAILRARLRDLGDRLEETCDALRLRLRQYARVLLDAAAPHERDYADISALAASQMVERLGGRAAVTQDATT